jgi:DNA-binding PadR family transcriptional regulator
MPIIQKQIHKKLSKGLLDLIILQYLKTKPMHGYQIISNIRKKFKVYFGPSTIYPLLASMEKEGKLKSIWNMNGDRPKKIYNLTAEGEKMLDFTQNTLSLMMRKLGREKVNPISFGVSSSIKSSIYA